MELTKADNTVAHETCCDCKKVISPGEPHLLINGKAYCEPCVKKAPTDSKMAFDYKMAEAELLAKNPILKHFKFDHLTNEKLKAASQPWCELAWQVGKTLPDGPEKSVALRKLIEGLDAARRATQ